MQRLKISSSPRRPKEAVIPAKAGIHLNSSYNSRMDPRLRGDDKTGGFTLLEVLIALFIFAILSMIMVGGLRSVIDVQSGTEKRADRLRDLQMATLLMSRDIEQAVERPVLDKEGQEEFAFMGTDTSLTFTHIGMAKSPQQNNTALQRVKYEWHDNALWRVVWPVLDQAPKTVTYQRPLLTNVKEVRFQYLQKKSFKPKWPPEEGDKIGLPRAVEVTLELENWGKLTQIYFINAERIDAKLKSSATGEENDNDNN